MVAKVFVNWVVGGSVKALQLPCGPFGNTRGGRQTDMEADWCLVVLPIVHGPIPVNGPLALLRGRTTVGSFWHVSGCQTGMETDWGLLGVSEDSWPCPSQQTPEPV